MVSELTPSEISQITGFADEPEKEEEALLDPDDLLPDESEEQDLSQNGLVRGGLLAIFVLFWLGLGGFIWWLLAAAHQARINLPQLESEEVAEVQDSQELGQLKAELALRDQQLPESPPPAKPREKVEPHKPEPKTKIKPKPRSVVRPQPVIRPQSLRPVVRPQPPVPKVDPQKRWQELAQIGAAKSQGKVEELAPVVNSSQSSPSRTLLAANQLIVNQQSSLAPQKVLALVEGGIALPTRTRSSQKLTVPLVLSEPLVDRDDQEIVPAGAILITEVSSSDSVMEFRPKTLTFEREERYYELNLTQGSVIVTGNQGPIIARTETIGADGEGLSLTQIGQLTTAAASLAGIERASELSLIFNALGGRSRRSFSRNQGLKLYTVAAGTEVVVRIVRNIPFNLPSATGNNSRFNLPPQTSSPPPVTESESDFDQEFVDNQEEEIDFENTDNYYEEQELDFGDE